MTARHATVRILGKPAVAPAALAALVILFSACGGGNRAPDVRPPVEGYGAVSSDAAVTRFLDAAQSENYPGMWAVFGTKDGPSIERFGVQEIEPRMVVLSRLLKHETYELKLANLAGLGPNRARYEVRMTGTRKGNVTVPFIAAHDAGGRWYVEQLEADRLSGGGALN